MKFITIIFFIITLIINVINAEKNIDAKWMNYINNSTYINQIVIPGTHDSGTYNVGTLSVINNKYAKYLNPLGLVTAQLSEFAQTQSMNIIEQLNNGIRYLDVRLGLENAKSEKLFLCHQ